MPIRSLPASPAPCGRSAHSGEVAGESDHLAGVGQHFVPGATGEAPAADPRDRTGVRRATPFEFGQPLGESRGRHPDGFEAAAAQLGASLTATRYSS